MSEMHAVAVEVHSSESMQQDTRQQAEIRAIVPPNLDEAHLGAKILCHRPMRYGMPCFDVVFDETGKKIIANHYGHGGSGWTLAPGSAEYIVNQVLSQQNVDFSLHSKIVIVGAGVIGLFTALNLWLRGYTNITIIAENYENLASHKAGGLIAPASMKNDDPSMEATFKKICLDSYRYFADIANGIHPIFKSGAKFLPAYFENRQSSNLEPYVNEVMQPAKDVFLDFGNGTIRSMIVYDDALFVETEFLMKSIKEFLLGKVIFHIQHISSLQDINASFIFNCCGIGAKELLNDPKLISVQGHLIQLKNQNQNHLQYMISVFRQNFHNSLGFHVQRLFYMFPKESLANKFDIGVVGGTFIEGAEENTPNEDEFNYIIQNAKEFYGLL